MHVIKKYGLTMALSVVVIISLILSIILWLNPSYEHIKRDNTNGPSDNITRKSLSYMYLPTQAIHTNRQGKQWIISDPDTNTVSEFIKRLNGGSHMIKLRSHSSRDYLKHLNRRRSVILNYQNNVTTSIFNSVAKGGFQKLPDQQFNRIVLPLDHSPYLYLLRDQDHTVYRVRLTHPLRGVNNIIRKRLRKIPIEMKLNYGRPIVNYPKTVRMPQYEYLINKQTRNYYIMHLLSGNRNIVRTRKKNHVTYSNESNRQLIFGPNKNVTYVNDRPTHINGNFNQSLYNSYHNLLALNLSLSGLHYFDYNPHTHTILYRGFVEGFPIFNPIHFGTISMQSINKELRYNYSLYSLQIPIPNDRKRIKLSNTRQVLKNLKFRGYNLRNVQAIEIGYEWQNAKTSKILANLIPTWFIKYNGHWLNYNQLGIA